MYVCFVLSFCPNILNVTVWIAVLSWKCGILSGQKAVPNENVSRYSWAIVNFKKHRINKFVYMYEKTFSNIM